MKNYHLILLCLFVFTTSFQSGLEGNEIIRRQIENQKLNPLKAGSEPIYCAPSLTKIYENRIFEPAWEYKNDLEQLIKSVEESRYEGLNPEDYHLTALKSLFSKFGDLNTQQKAQLDLLATDAFLLYTTHLLSGKVNPESIDSEWHVKRREGDPVLLFNNAISKHDIYQQIQSALPLHSVYKSLQQALIKYDSIRQAGGWNRLGEGVVLKEGAVDERVPMLRTRLKASGDFVLNVDENNLVYDEELVKAVMRFQKRHGLETDGNLGKETLAALNISVDERMTQIKVNMERWRWLPQEYSDYYVKVNIANYTVDIVKNGELVRQHKAIVGKNYRRTPVFSSKISYLVLNPTWTVPPGIINGDVIPSVKKDVNYLKTKNIVVYDHAGNIINPNTVDWNNSAAKSYTYRQPAGPANALGAVKFMFPNNFSVYLHDTPSRELFEKTERSFSSGCIRVQNPLQLAVYFIGDSVHWNMSKIKKQVESQNTLTIPLSEKPDIYILYWTAWTDAKGVIQFRKDIYSRDQKVSKALAEHL